MLWFLKFFSLEALFSPSFKNELKHLNSTQWQTKSRRASENCATVEAYDPRYDNLIQKLRHACINRATILPSAETKHSANKIASQFWHFTASQFQVKFNNYNLKKILILITRLLQLKYDQLLYLLSPKENFPCSYYRHSCLDLLNIGKILLAKFLNNIW